MVQTICRINTVLWLNYGLNHMQGKYMVEITFRANIMIETTCRAKGQYLVEITFRANNIMVETSCRDNISVESLARPL
jgi:hypothetical protein